MFCSKCGEFIPEGSRYCPNCGTDSQQPQLPMKWFKFLIYFLMFANALLFLSQAASFFTGSQYGDSAASVYHFFSGLKAVDMVMGVLYLGAAAYSIYTRFMLSGYKRIGPKCMYAYYAVNVGLQVLYTALACIVFAGVNANLATELLTENLPTLLGSVVGCVLGIALNRTYFNKRAHLFVN